jgi:non-specific serine/threonine protein kinase
LLLLIKEQKEKHQPHLLILPASLLGNWQAEISRFAPQLSLWIAHSGTNRNDQKPDLSKVDIIITTYGTLNRLPWLSETSWNIVILDEAQAIKNPTAKQTRAIKLLTSRVRFMLTGTPIENRLLDLWSLFDFVAPGLLGSSRVFADLSKSKSKNANTENKGQFFAAVRRLVNPYILRRLKSDKRIISDLPDKTEMQAYCTLTKQQIGLYQQAVNELAAKLENQVDDINRRGLVMSYLLRFKQICNHPNQWLGHGHYDHELSGKFLRLKELCETIVEKQEKVLIFTQFREIIPALSGFLAEVFKREGLTLDGQTKAKERAKRVEQFQQDQGPPFFVLSLKAGGTGLNLTAASHVIHFDRWWNPAVENQATDRAFRIGQKKNVLVHKFICRGTIEEKIDSLINSKKALSSEIMGRDNEIILTELSDAELMNMVTLDIHRAVDETNTT